MATSALPHAPDLHLFPPKPIKRLSLSTHLANYGRVILSTQIIYQDPPPFFVCGPSGEGTQRKWSYRAPKKVRPFRSWWTWLLTLTCRDMRNEEFMQARFLVKEWQNQEFVFFRKYPTSIMKWIVLFHHRYCQIQSMQDWYLVNLLNKITFSKQICVLIFVLCRNRYKSQRGHSILQM